MSETNSNSNRSQQPGLIELVSPLDLTVKERPPLVDFGVIGNMLDIFEARNKDIFLYLLTMYFKVSKNIV